MTALLFIDADTDLDALLSPYQSDESETHYVSYFSELSGKTLYFDKTTKSGYPVKSFATRYTKAQAERAAKKMQKADPGAEYKAVLID